jgi:hypothetical protein
MIRFDKHTKMKNILRPGGKHEMMPVAAWQDLRKMEVKLEDIQILSHPTDETYFQVVDPESKTKEWRTDEIKHGKSIHYDRFGDFGVGLQELGYNAQYKTIGSGKAHNEIFDVIANSVENNHNKATFLQEVENWMRGNTGGTRFTRVHINHLQPWLDKLEIIRIR